jgi:hypothetical protein
MLERGKNGQEAARVFTFALRGFGERH